MAQAMPPRGSTARTGRLSVKVGDLVRWESVANDNTEVIWAELGLVVEIGLTTALILFSDNVKVWLRINDLEIING